MAGAYFVSTGDRVVAHHHFTNGGAMPLSSQDAPDATVADKGVGNVCEVAKSGENMASVRKRYTFCNNKKRSSGSMVEAF